MRTQSVIAGLLLFALPASAVAVQPPIFQMFYDEAGEEGSRTDPSEDLANYVIDEMETWHGRGITLTADDLHRAITDELWNQDNTGLCQKKKDPSGADINFLQGGENLPGSCLALQTDILSLIDFEREADVLGTDLLIAAGGSELSIADEPHRPVDMATFALGLRRVWSGTGASVIPWDGSADTEFDKLDTDLQALSRADLEKAVLRFHFGYYRDKREADPRFSGIADTIRDDLKAIGDKIGVVDNPVLIGVFAIPDLKAPNVGLWARKDDIGLMWVYPSRFTRLSYKQADRYPVLKPGSDRLGYPYSYSGPGVAAGPGIDAPLCSRTVGRHGDLCKPLPPNPVNCSLGVAPNAITLKECSSSGSLSLSGPDICPDFNKLFLDTGAPLLDPANPAALNPALKLAGTGSICTPGTRLLYQDDIASHACYVGFCLKQSMAGSGHTLVPNRSPVIVNEMTSPYLACIRPDPQLGLYTEVTVSSPYPLPEYLGAFLVHDFDRQYCGTNGSAPQPIAGLCSFDDNEQAPMVHASPEIGELAGLEQETNIDYRQQIHEVVAEQAGARAALNQSIELQRKVFARLASFVQQTADLFLELRNAPLTQSACPWTGPFKSSSSSSS